MGFNAQMFLFEILQICTRTGRTTWKKRDAWANNTVRLPCWRENELTDVLVWSMVSIDKHATHPGENWCISFTVRHRIWQKEVWHGGPFDPSGIYIKFDLWLVLEWMQLKATITLAQFDNGKPKHCQSAMSGGFQCETLMHVKHWQSTLYCPH